MKKIIALLICVIVSLGGLSSCALGILFQYQFNEGISVVLGNDTKNYTAEIVFVMDGDSDYAQTMGDYFYNILKNHYTDMLQDSKDGMYYADGNNLVYLHYMLLSESSFISGKDSEDKGFFTSDVSITYNNPFIDLNSPLSALPILLNAPLTNGILPVSASSFHLFVPSNRRDTVNDGKVVAYNGAHYAKWSFESGASPVLEVEYTYMVSYAWYIIAIIIGTAVVGLILLVAKKGGGKTKQVQKSAPQVRILQSPFDEYDNNKPAGGSNNSSGSSPFEGY